MATAWLVANATTEMLEGLSAMQPVPIEKLVENPVGRYARGDHFVIWCVHRELCGLALWGRPTQGELELLTYVYDRGETSGIAIPCDFVLDTHHVAGIDREAFERLIRDGAQRVAGLHRRIRRQALLRGPGTLGALISGFYPMLDVAIPTMACVDYRAAFEWLGEPDFAEGVEALVAACVAGMPAVDRLRAWLLTRLELGTTLDEAARELGLSARSLQRQLREVGSSFRAELDAVRLEQAKQLLLETDLKIAAVATRIGAATEASFIAFFRKQTAQSPAAWRRARRGR